MAWLLFKRSAKKLFLMKGQMPSVLNAAFEIEGVWDAHNSTASKSKGPWPAGVYRWSHYNAHLGQEIYHYPFCYANSYGCDGIQVFEVSSRSGMGVHSGRNKGQSDIVGGKTLGCIRTTNQAMQTINSLHQYDHLQGIHVQD